MFDPWRRIWRSWALGKCQFFLWLAAHDRCWTAGRLARRNLPHPELCPLCDQEVETINHLLVSCVFTREFWFLLLQGVGLGVLAPQPSDPSFQDWWHRSSSRARSSDRKGLNSLIIHGAWTLWRHCNDSVFLWWESRYWPRAMRQGAGHADWARRGGRRVVSFLRTWLYLCTLDRRFFVIHNLACTFVHLFSINKMVRSSPVRQKNTTTCATGKIKLQHFGLVILHLLPVLLKFHQGHKCTYFLKRSQYICTNICQILKLIVKAWIFYHSSLNQL
jgi:hypothetical protein